jgi:hypothetical protein
MHRTLRFTGLVACFTALLAMTGAHWLALQSVAWTRMLVAFSQQDSLGTALGKTFDGKHPCPICVRVQQGWQQEQKQQQKTPALRLGKAPELLWELRQLAAPPIPTSERAGVAFVPSLHPDFIESPPSPPPRREPHV